jgi:hypothetical protein
MLTEPEIEAVAERVAEKVLGFLGRSKDSGDQIVRGSFAIARFLGVSNDTFRRRHLKSIPACKYEEYNHRGVKRLRPICRLADLKRYRDGSGLNRARLTFPAS